MLTQGVSYSELFFAVIVIMVSKFIVAFLLPNFGIPKCTALVELTVEEIKINDRIVCLFLGQTSMDACRQRQLAKKSRPTHLADRDATTWLRYKI